MQILKTLIITLFILISTTLLYPDTIKPEFRLQADFQIAPYYYEYTRECFVTSLNGTLMGGVRLKRFTIGLEVKEFFNSYHSDMITGDFRGSYNLLRTTITGYFEIFDWFEVKWGAGGGWLSTSFKYEQDYYGYEGNYFLLTHKGGISFSLAARLKPYKYIDLLLITTFDLYFTLDTVDPYYYTGIRCNIHPYFYWVNLYVETGVAPWYYESEYVEVQTVMFYWAFGISLDMMIPRSIKAQKIKKDWRKEVITEDTTPDTDVEITEVPDTKPLEQDKIATLRNAAPGDTVTFNSITFTRYPMGIAEESRLLMDQISAVLTERPALTIEITNYIRSTDADATHITEQQAAALKNYLITTGITPNRLYTFGYGTFTEKHTNLATDSTIEIKLLHPVEVNNSKALDTLNNAPVNTSITFYNINFKDDSDVLLIESYPILNQIAVILKKDSTKKILVEGFTKGSRNAYYDFTVATRRGYAIKNYLLRKGIPENRILVSASGKIYGEKDILQKKSIEITIINEE